MSSIPRPVTRQRILLTVITVWAFAACVDQPLAPAELKPSASVEALIGQAPDTILNRWVVLVPNDAGQPVELSRQLIALYGGQPIHFYENAVKGYAVANLPVSSVSLLRQDPRVILVEESVPIRETSVQFLPLDNSSFQSSSLWSLDRIDVRQQAFNGEFTYQYTGAGVHIYIVDSGIRCGHQEFAGRIGDGVTRLSFSSGASPCIDSNGHGTGVASAAAGSTYGIAKDATLHPVRINDSNNTAYCDDIVAGLDWVAGYAIHPAIANLSYGDVPNCFSVRNAMEGVVNAGITMTKSAGNENFDAYQDRANRAAGAIIVGATDYFDNRATFASGLSAYGPTLTVFVPGYAVRVAWTGDNANSQIVYGTSFAAPYVAGVASTYLQQNPFANAFAVRDVVRRSATPGALYNVGTGSPNLLLNSLLRSVAIQGPSEISSDADATYTWSAVTTGSVQSYLWEISINGGGYSTVSTSTSYSRTIFAGDSYSFALRLTAVVDGEQLTTSQSVNVSPPPPPPECGTQIIC